MLPNDCPLTNELLNKWESGFELLAKTPASERNNGSMMLQFLRNTRSSKIVPTRTRATILGVRINPLAFANNDPVNFVDPYGLFCLPPDPEWCYYCVVCIVFGGGPEDPVCWYPCTKCAEATAGGSLN
jgi:hypothetical protein